MSFRSTQVKVCGACLIQFVTHDLKFSVCLHFVFLKLGFEMYGSDSYTNLYFEYVRGLL